MNVFSRTLILAVLISLAIGMGSAAVLSSYGIISGTAEVKPAVQLTEVQYNPDDQSTQEFVVVKNLADQKMDLAGWRISDSDSTDELSEFNSSYSTELGSGEKAYITEEEEESTLNISLSENRLAVDNAIGSANLADSGETVYLKYKDGETLDSVNYTDSDCQTDQSYQRDSYNSKWSCEVSSLKGEN